MKPQVAMKLCTTFTLKPSHSQTLKVSLKPKIASEKWLHSGKYLGLCTRIWIILESVKNIVFKVELRKFFEITQQNH